MDGCRRAKWIILSVLMTAFTLALVGEGCISDQGTFHNLEFRGYVLRITDSTAVPGALIIIDRVLDKYILATLRTDDDGFYEYRRTFPAGDKPLKILLTVADIDGDTNGVFVSQDTTLYDGVMIEHWMTYEVDFFVEMVEDTSSGL